MFGLRKKLRLSKALKAAATAQAAYRSAVERGDTMDQHTAYLALVAAQHERLRLEVKR